MVKSNPSSSSSLSLPDASIEPTDTNPGMSSGEDLTLTEGGVHVLTPPTVSAPQIEILEHDESSYPSQLAPSDESITNEDVEADPILNHLAGQQRSSSSSSSSPSKFRARPAPESMYVEGVGPRLSKSAALRMGLPWDDPRDHRRVSGAEMPVNFDNVPGHKRTGLAVNVASLAEPTVAPRQNRAAMLRAGQPVPTPKEERDRAEMAAQNRARAAEERMEKRKNVARPASLMTPTALPRQNRAALLRAGLPAEQQAMRAPSEMAEAAARNKAREQAEYAERRRTIQVPASLAAPVITPRSNRASQLRTGTGDTPTPSRIPQPAAVPPPRPPRSHMRALSNVSRTTESSTNSAPGGVSKTTSRASSSAATSTSGFGPRVASDRTFGSAGAVKSMSRASSSTGLSAKAPSDRTLGQTAASPSKHTPKSATPPTKNASPTKSASSVKSGLTKSPSDRALSAKIAVDNIAAEKAEAERLERMARRQTMATLPRGAASGPAALTYAAEKADAERAALQKIAERKEEAARKAAAKAAQDKADWDRFQKRKSLAVSRTTAAPTSKTQDKLPAMPEKRQVPPPTEGSTTPAEKRQSATYDKPDLTQAEKRQSQAVVLGRATGLSAAAEIKAQAERSALERAELAAAERLERLARRQTFSNVRSLSGSAPKAPALSRISSRSSARSGSLRTEESGVRTDFGVKVPSPHKPLPLLPQPESQHALGLDYDLELAQAHADALEAIPAPNRFLAPRPAPAPPPGRPISTLSFAPLPEAKRDDRRDEKRSSSLFSKLLNKSSPKTTSPRTPNRHSILSTSSSSRNVNRTSMISSPRHPVDSAGL